MAADFTLNKSVQISYSLDSKVSYSMIKSIGWNFKLSESEAKLFNHLYFVDKNGTSAKWYPSRKVAYQDIVEMYKKIEKEPPVAEITRLILYSFRDYPEIEISFDPDKKAWKAGMIIRDSFSKELEDLFDKEIYPENFSSLKEASKILRNWLIFNKINPNDHEF